MSDYTELEPDDAVRLAETEKLLAEARLATVEAETKAVELELSQLAAQRRLHYERVSQAHDGMNYIYRFDEPVHGESVFDCRRVLEAWTRVAPEGQGFEVVINSGGGSVFDGLELGDVIRKVSESGHPVTVRVAGIAASMAGAILQFADHRIVGRHSYLHLHEVSTMALGKASSLADTAELAERLTRQICDLYAKRSQGKTTGAKLHNWIKRNERYLSAEEALKRGFCDEIG